MSEPLAEGTRIGPFEIEAVIATGSSAVVYRARLVSMFERDDYPEKVALKLFTMLDEEQRIAVLNEFAHADSYNSPYVTTLYPPIESRDQVALVYELGEYTLRDRLKAGALTTPELERLLHDVTNGLVALHENHTIHSDLKPANILRVGDGWKLNDLGAATRFTLEADDTIAVLRAYNRPYLSPELARQLSAPGPHDELTTRRSDDMWALGITLFEAATGVHPFVESEVRSSAELSDVTIPARLYQSDLPLSIGEVIEKCLDPVPERRWVSAVVLRSWLYPSESDAVATRFNEPQPSPADRPPGAPADSQRARFNKTIISALVAVVLVAGIAATAARRGKDAPTSASAPGPSAAVVAPTNKPTSQPTNAPLATPATAPAEEPTVLPTAAQTTLAVEASAGPADPQAPLQIGPVDATDTRTPNYQWQAVAGAAYYLIWVNQIAEPFVGGKINQLYTPAEVGCPDGTGTCSVTPTTEIAAGGEWWVSSYFAGSDVAHVSDGQTFSTS